jgi:hypothetical protein
MKLTNETRDRIVRSMAMEAIAKEKEALTKRENAIALKCWKAVYPAAERAAAAKMPDGWMCMDKCLRFNLYGMNITINTAEAVPVKAGVRYGCQRLGDIADEKLRDEYQAYYKDLETLKQKAADIERQGKALLYSVTTFKKLEEIWPEGKKFYEKYRPISEKSGVPAALTSSLNNLVGIKAKGAK